MDNNLDEYIKENFGYVEFTEEQKEIIRKTKGFATYELNKNLLHLFTEIEADFNEMMKPIIKALEKNKGKSYKKKNKEVKNWEKTKFYQR